MAKQKNTLTNFEPPKTGIIIKIDYKGNSYFSSQELLNNKEIQEIKNLITRCCIGDEKFLWLKNETQNMYFPKDVLLNSVITLHIG